MGPYARQVAIEQLSSPESAQDTERTKWKVFVLSKKKLDKKTKFKQDTSLYYLVYTVMPCVACMHTFGRKHSQQKVLS